MNILFVLIYVISMIASWFGIRYQIKESCEEPSFSHVVRVFLPVVNTISVVFSIWEYVDNNLGWLIYKFFRI